MTYKIVEPTVDREYKRVVLGGEQKQITRPLDMAELLQMAANWLKVYYEENEPKTKPFFQPFLVDSVTVDIDNGLVVIYYYHQSLEDFDYYVFLEKHEGHDIALKSEYGAQSH